MCVAPLALTLGGCLSSSGPTLTASLPEAPATFGKPVARPRLKDGADLRIFAAHQGTALSKANGRLTDDKSFYSDVRQRFGK